ncbi:MAG TPA: transposase [Ktedonobacteraceae bacterium]
MTKTYRFRLFPTRRQQTTLNSWLALCCEVYNAALQERRDAYRMAGKSLGYSLQCAELPGCKDVRPELAEVHSQVLQEVVRRVDLASEAFFRRCEKGEHPGYPRFKSHFRYDSLTFKQYGNSFSLTSGSKQKGTLILSKIGHIKTIMHRRITGTPKTAIVKRTPTGKWFVSITVEPEGAPETLPPTEEQVGIDVGLTAFAYLSTGEHIDNPRFFREEEAALVHAQRRLSLAQPGTKQHRENFIRQQVTTLVRRFGLIAVEAW